VILALGIGVTTAVFTVVNSAVLRRLPVLDPERLAVLAAGDGVGREFRTWPSGVWEQLHARAGLFDAIAAWSIPQSFSLSKVGNESDTVEGRFGGAPDVIGAPIIIDRIPFTVVGVTPPEFHGIEVGRTFDVAIPLALEPMMRGTDSRLDNGAYWLRILLRLQRDQSAEAATALLRSIQPHIATEGFHGSPTVNREAFLQLSLALQGGAE
jgi:hypothetical protein